MLKRDFGFGDQINSSNKSSDAASEEWRQVVKVVDPSLSTTGSLFGIDPWKDDFIEDAPTAFEAWKGWVKVNSRFYQKGNVQSAAKDTHLVRAPFFLRAARFWQQVFQWCDLRQESHGSSRCREQIKSTLVGGEGWTGLSHSDWDSCQDKTGLEACYAVFAFNRGQRLISDFPELTAMQGLMGCYAAYGAASSICLQFQSGFIREGTISGAPGQGRPARVIVGFDIGNIRRLYIVNSRSGALECFVPHQGTEPAVTVDGEITGTSMDRSDDFLLWLEEHVRRLRSGESRVEPVPVRDTVIEGITLYPQFPLNSSPVITEGVQCVSRAVTRGVEVIASAVYVPGSNRFGFIYSVRIRLLTRQDEGEYVSPSQRGFETCQLWSRHWRITDDVAGTTHEVDGEGVIGMYPLLHEGGYTESGDSFDGIFQYQSCTGGAMKRGSFAGHLRFVPGSIESPTGSQFEVEVKPFELRRPRFLY